MIGHKVREDVTLWIMSERFADVKWVKAKFPVGQVVLPWELSLFIDFLFISI